jgi:glyoxylase-like metal-dependent hydrolase (beta-lactamase superfamily II)
MMRRPSSYYQSVRVKDNLYFYIWQGMGNNCNSSLFVNILEGDRPHVLIDPGSIADEMREPCFDELVKAIEKNGFNAQDVGLIIDTHIHSDHCAANQPLIEITRNSGKSGQAELAMHKEDDAFRRGAGKQLSGWLAALGIEVPPFEPTMLLDEGDLMLGQEKLQVLHTPGHSPGSISLYWPKEKVLITGDAVFYGSIGRTDFPGGSLATLKRSVEKLSQLDVEYLLPGHSTEYGSLIDSKAKVERNFQMIQNFFF